MAILNNDMDRNILRSHTRRNWFVICGSAVIGSVSPDIGHGLNLINPQIGWNCTHNWSSVVCWVSIALCIGLLSGFLLRRR